MLSCDGLGAYSLFEYATTPFSLWTSGSESHRASAAVSDASASVICDSVSCSIPMNRYGRWVLNDLVSERRWHLLLRRTQGIIVQQSNKP